MDVMSLPVSCQAGPKCASCCQFARKYSPDQKLCCWKSGVHRYMLWCHFHSQSGMKFRGGESECPHFCPPMQNKNKTDTQDLHIGPFKCFALTCSPPKLKCLVHLPLLRQQKVCIKCSASTLTVLETHICDAAHQKRGGALCRWSQLWVFVFDVLEFFQL